MFGMDILWPETKVYEDQITELRIKERKQKPLKFKAHDEKRRYKDKRS